MFEPYFTVTQATLKYWKRLLDFSEEGIKRLIALDLVFCRGNKVVFYYNGLAWIVLAEQRTQTNRKHTHKFLIKNTKEK